MTFFANFKTPRLIAAHRGYRANRPENTLSAFVASLGRCHYIELDIQFSNDGVPVIIHDRTLDRTSNARLFGRDFTPDSTKVNDWNLDELKQLDMGSWFLDADPFATLRNGDVTRAEVTQDLPQEILTLEELLTHPRLQSIPLNVEVKNQENDTLGHKLIKTAINIIVRTGSQERILLSSFNHDYLRLAKSLLPELSTGALQEKSHPGDLISYLHHLHVAAYHPDDTITDRHLIQELLAAGIRTNIFTVNSRQRQKELFDFGATSIITDFPDLSSCIA